MCATGDLILIAVLFAAPPSVEDLTPVQRLTPDFYNAIAVGKRVEAAWSADPATVPRDGELTLTLTVRNAANPHELARPNLGGMDAVMKHFQVIDRTDPPAERNATEARFTYTLRPRDVGAASVLALKYVYYRADLKEF